MADNDGPGALEAMERLEGSPPPEIGLQQPLHPHQEHQGQATCQSCEMGSLTTSVLLGVVDPLLSSALYCTCSEALHHVSSCLCPPWLIHSNLHLASEPPQL